MRSNANRDSGSALWWNAVKNHIGLGSDEYDEYEDEYEDEALYSKSKFRVRVPVSNRVSFWKNLVTIDDTEPVAEMLKNGQQQIVNLETIDDDAEITRIVDFLGGVVFALNGQVKNIGKKVYLFTPSNFDVEECEKTDEKKRSWNINNNK